MTLTPGMGVGDRLGPQRSRKNTKNHKNIFVRELFTLLGLLFQKCQALRNNIFKICSYIQKTTTKRINALKITIYNTKYTSNQQIHFNNPKILKIRRNVSSTSIFVQKIIFISLYTNCPYLILCILLYILYILYIIYILIHVHM